MKTWIQNEEKKKICCDFCLVCYDLEHKVCFFTLKDNKCRIKKEINEKLMVAETLEEFKTFLNSVGLDIELVQTYNHFILYNIVRKKSNYITIEDILNRF